VKVGFESLHLDVYDGEMDALEAHLRDEMGRVLGGNFAGGGLDE
jgi:hypothetical protein